MEVLKHFNIPNDNGHSIEWGNLTWGLQQNPQIFIKSIRNRFENANGGFNQAASSEIPWDDFILLIKESIKQDQFSKNELTDLIKEIAVKL